ncbi:aminotransferase [Streptomyces sp. 150FB]|uniref:amylo-alpha-1,6-glucosidase n=1 Tax=Streptomyces sp. 150FB TaxID=1576605 RepID=UPI000588F476|nr:glycogen debranching N-terminal domain-containing protein [Streptomyces sp. 150FB]KIF78378.1 aminotransferase [Streptomyces sp. 150FB]
MREKRQLLVHAGTFAVLDAQGDIEGSRGTAPDGMFVRDARHLSRWQLTVDGVAPAVLVPAGDGESDAATVLTPPGTRDEPPSCTLFRRQALYEGRLTETITVVSNVSRATCVTIAVEADADFTDQFELRSDRRTYSKPGATRAVLERPDGLEFGYRRDDWHSGTTVTAHPPPTLVGTTGSASPGNTARSLVWQLELPAHARAELTLNVTAEAHGAPPLADLPSTPGQVRRRTRLANEPYTRGAPLPLPDPADRTVQTDLAVELASACAQGIADLARLRVPATGPDGEALQVPGAGVPWFLTLFGRDSALTSFFALPYRPETARATLLALAATQATGYLPDRVAQPGKIVHEVRHGELAHFGQVPYGRYYGSVDSTPLFLVLLHAHAAQTGDPAVARRLEGHARAAVDWMFHDGGLGSRGYLVYEAHEQGLANQNWKDSAGAVCFRDGTQLTGAIAVAEAQGYAYDALRRTANLARTVWRDPGWAERLEDAAARLRKRFQRDFWLPAGGPDDQGFPALALDGAGRPAGTLASDAGHLLWSGILDEDRARAVGRRLLEPDFFSGWGIRTLASGQPPYHPLSYHRGSIWPHDNAIIALGLARYGMREQTETLAAGLLAAASHYGHRLPEVIAGYPRERGQGPIPYPHANSPQAWAASTPLAMLTAVRAGRTET